MGKYADALMADAPAEQPASRKYSSQLLDSPPIAQSEPPAAKQEGWGEWIVNSVRGRQDPKEAATGTVFEQFRNELESPTATAAIMGANDAAMGDIIQKNLGDKFLRREKDANNYEVIVSRGPNGQEQRGYVNKPGLDTQDLWRFGYGAAPYLIGGGVAGTALKEAGVGLNALAQATTAGTTSIAGDIGSTMQGSEQGIDLEKAGVTAALGAAGPAAVAAGSALWRKFVTIPGLIDQSSGKLTAKGLEAARRAGVDPGDVTPEWAQSFAKNFAKSGDEAQAATTAGFDQFGIPATRGQITKDPYLLTQEEGMRRRLYGEKAQDTMRGFDQRQAEAISYATLGDDRIANMGAPVSRPASAPKQGIGEMIAPNRQAGSTYDRTPAALGEGVQEGLKAAKKAAKTAEDAAWKKASALEVTDEAIAELPAIINAKLAGRMPNQRSTPAAFDMAQEIQRIIKGEAPEKAADFLEATPTRNVDEMRRGLLEILKSAKEDGDKSIAGKMYDGFNDWIGTAAQKNMLKGDPAAAMELVKARGFTKEMRELFRPTLPDGRASPVAARLRKIENADSGEAVVKALFGDGTKPVDGTVQTLKNLKMVIERYAPDQLPAFDDVGLAYFTRLVTGRNGELVGPTAIVNNLKGAFQNSKTVMDTLYNPAKQAQMRLLLRSLERVAYKPPNASGSGYSAATFAQEGIMKVLKAFGLDKPATAALQFTKVGDAWNAATARQAVDQMTRPVRPNLTPALTGAGPTVNNNQSGR